MYRRILFVGLGGSGGKTLRYLKKDFREWLTRVGWNKNDPIPRGFQFLHIDTPTAEDGGEITNVKMLDDNEYVGLIGPNVTLTSVVHGIDNGPNYLDTAGWRVAPNAIHVSIQDGAGQYRGVGRTIAVSQIRHLEKGLKDAAERVLAIEAVQDNSRLWTSVTKQPLGSLEQPLAVIITSLAGGTGAGLLIDVCDILRMKYPTWGSGSIGILYTPEVFSNVPPAYITGVHANSLAAITELLNGYYLKGTDAGAVGNVGDGFVGVRRSRFLSAVGLNAGVQSSGPQYPFLVGRSNSANMTYAEDVQVFAAIGSVLSLLCRDPAVQERIQKMTFENWDGQANGNIGSADLLVTKGSTEERGKAVFQALGCAKVSVGTNYLRRYGAARLAREAYRWITRYHLDEADGRALDEQGIKDPSDKAREIAKKHVSWFLKAASLDERGHDRNDITKFLTPDEISTEMVKAADELRRLVGGDRNEKIKAEGWLALISDNLNLVIQDLEASVMPLVDRQVAEWVRTHPDILVRTTEECVARYGLLVTSEILRLVQSDLVDPANGVASEMMGPSELGYYQSQSQEVQWFAAAQAELGGTKGKFSLNDNDAVTRAINAAVENAAMRIDARIREITALLITEFSESVIGPMIAAVSQAHADVAMQQDGVATWPSWTYGPDTPDPEFQPFKNEITLIEPKNFSDEFVKQLASSMNGTIAEREDHKSAARFDVISGQWLRELSEQQNRDFDNYSIIRRAKWSPSYNLIRESSQSRFEVDVRMDPDSLRERADAWLNREGTSIQLFLNQGLATYTNKSEKAKINVSVSLEEITKRQTDFIAKFGSAVQMSAPLVGLNTQLQTALNVEGGAEKSFSQLPFAAPHPLEKDVIAAVRASLDDIPANLMTSNDVQTVEVISALPGPQQPVLVSSLMRPIGEKWSSVQNSGAKKISFWSFRRARKFDESIPAPQSHIVAMIRGWFTTHAFGLLEVPARGDRKIQIAHWSANLPPADFPYPMLSTATDNVESGRTESSLFAVLESLGLAMVAVCERSNASALNAYIALRDFGLTTPSDDEGPILGYSKPNPLIREWIRDGEVKTLSRSEKQLRQGLDSKMLPGLVGHATPEERCAALKRHFGALREWTLNQEAEFLAVVETQKPLLNSTDKWRVLLTSSDGENFMVRALGALEASVEKWNE
jgi:hypothetical protein